MYGTCKLATALGANALATSQDAYDGDSLVQTDYAVSILLAIAQAERLLTEAAEYVMGTVMVEWSLEKVFAPAG